MIPSYINKPENTILLPEIINNLAQDLLKGYIENDAKCYHLKEHLREDKKCSTNSDPNEIERLTSQIEELNYQAYEILAYGKEKGIDIYKYFELRICKPKKPKI